MISRHFLRSKVLQLAYADYANPSDTAEVQQTFRQHIDSLNNLGILQLSAMQQFVEVAATMMDEAQHKFMPTEAEKNPNYRMAHNVVLRRLADNLDYRKHLSDANINWGGVSIDEVFRQAYHTWNQMPVYSEYLKSEETFANDLDYVLKLFKFLMNYELLCDKIYPMSLFWEDDFDQIAQYNFKMLRNLTESFNEASVVPLVCDLRDEADSEAYNFACQLLASTLCHREEVEAMTRKYLQGWEYERVAEMDIIILNMAVAELTECPTIPERVTMDEYIELSKEFSSERSKLFINGILGKFIIELRAAGRINKTGRGVVTLTPDEEMPEYSADTTPADEEPPVHVLTRKTRPRIKKSLPLGLIVPLLLFLLCACHGNRHDDGIDIDLIQNPITAEGYDNNAAMPAITFDCDMHDFGRLSEGESISYSFHFRNTGNADLVITGCHASCGCTVADYPRKRIAPGGEGYIAVTFNSQGKAGQQYQEVSVLTNAQPSRTVLKIVAQVSH